nr:copia protein [Tanacetum cinerariifolium]
PPKEKNQRAFVGGSWSDSGEEDDEKVKNETCLEAQASSETSPLVDDDLDEEEAIKVTKKKNLENDIEDETLEIDKTELVSQHKNMTIIETKWVFRNKLHKNGIVSRNKARLVAQGYNQEEGIDYDETYALVSRLELIRILLAYACDLDFKLFYMDVKSAFLNGFINEEGTSIETVLYVESDHARDYVDRKSTSSICTFVGCCLTSWFWKKQTALAISTIKADYVSIEKACQQALWMKQAFIDYDVRHDHVPIMCNNKGGHKDHVSACLCHMLYCIKTFTRYNLAFFILKRIEKTQNKPKELLPYEMILTRMFKHVVFVFLKLAIDHYLSHARFMHPLVPHYEQNMRSDHGKKRPRESNASSSSTTLNHPSSSRPLDDTIDVNNDESFHLNSSSPSRNISSSSNVVSRVRQKPPHESH